MEDELAAMRKKKINQQVSKDIKADLERRTFDYDFYKSFEKPKVVDELEVLRRQKMMNSLADWKKANPPEPTEPLMESVGGGIAGALIPAAIHYANQATHNEFNPLDIKGAGEGEDELVRQMHAVSRGPSQTVGVIDQARLDVPKSRQQYIDSLAAQGAPRETIKRLVGGRNVGDPMVANIEFQELQKIPADEQIDLYNKELERKLQAPPEDYSEPDKSWGVKEYLDSLKKGQLTM